MKQIFDQFLRFLQQGIAIVELVWNWSIDQISKLMQVPWHDWTAIEISAIFGVFRLVYTPAPTPILPSQLTEMPRKGTFA
jgi:hypothetical protein